MTVVRPRPNRRVVISSTSANASAVAVRSCGPSPTTARRPSDETIWFDANCDAAHVDFPTPAGPTSTTKHGDGRTSGPSSSTPASYARRRLSRPARPPVPPPPANQPSAATKA